MTARISYGPQIPAADGRFQMFANFQSCTKMRNSRCSVFVLVAMVLTGCGGADDTPSLGYVTGKVTLNGTPLEGVILVFKPDNGRAATGTTNAEGEYELEFAYGVNGCKVGPNNVALELPLGSTKAKALPPRYTSQSELEADVKEGSNTFDFPLTTDDGGEAESLTIPD